MLEPVGSTGSSRAGSPSTGIPRLTIGVGLVCATVIFVGGQSIVWAFSKLPSMLYTPSQGLAGSGPGLHSCLQLQFPTLCSLRIEAHTTSVMGLVRGLLGPLSVIGDW